MNDGHHVAPRDPGWDDLAWMQDLCTPAEWLALRTLIAEHDQRLQHLALAARTQAVADALLDNAQTNPTLAAVLQRIGSQGHARREGRAPDN